MDETRKVFILRIFIFLMFLSLAAPAIAQYQNNPNPIYPPPAKKDPPKNKAVSTQDRKKGIPLHKADRFYALKQKTPIPLSPSGNSSKPVTTLHAPVPLELRPFGLRATLRELGAVTLRDMALSPDGGILAYFNEAFDSARDLAERLAATPGVAAHGLFAPDLVSEIIVATGKTVTTTAPGGQL